MRRPHLLATMILIIVSAASLWAQPNATVTTDQPDYPPGSTAIITGSGFAPGETVQLQVVNLTNPSDAGPEHDPWTVTADADGNFTGTWYVTEDEANTTLLLTATGLTSGLVARVEFTDSSGPTSITLGSQSVTNAFGTGGSPTYSITTSGGNGNLSLTYSISFSGGTPLGVSSSFSPNPVTHNGSPWNTTLTITTTGSTPAGTYSFTIANDASSATITGTLTVNKASSTIGYGATTNFNYTRTGQTPTITFSGSTGARTTNYLGTGYSSVNAPTNAGSYTLSNTVAADSNYSGVTNTQAFTISKTNLTITAQANTKTYDGTTSSTTNAAITSGSIQTGDTAPTWTQTYNSPYVGTGKTLTPASLVVTDGNGGANYNYTYTSASTGVINGKSVTITNVTASNKTYDGTNTATLNNGSAGVSGAISGDTVTLTVGSGTFASKNVGTWAVTASGYALTTSGISTNYTLSAQPSVPNASILNASVTITGVTASNKVYDGTTNATLSGGAVSGALSGDTVTFTAGSGGFASKNVGTWAVTASGYALSTSGISTNYSLSAQPTVPNASITVRSVTITNVTASSKTYDGTNTATLSGGAVSNAVSGDAVTFTAGNGTFASKNVGAWAVTATGYALTGSGVSTNYSLSAQPLISNASISARSLTVSATGVNKTYNGTTNATVTLSDNKVSGDTVTDSYTSAGFTDKNVGTGKTVNVYGISISGGDAGNYSLANTTATTTANITAASSSVSVASSLNPSGYHDSVSFTATLPSDATGNVIFIAGSSPISTNAISSGSAGSTATILIPRGTNTITARYAGDSNYIGATNTLAGGQVVTNHPPVAGNFSVTNSVNAFILNFSAILTNASDVDGDSLAIAGITTSTNGVNIVTNSLRMRYNNTNGVNDRFNYIVTDGFSGTATGAVSVVFFPFPLTGQSATLTPTAGKVKVKNYGIPAYRYGIQRSTNFTSWVTIQITNAPSNGVFEYEDSFSDLGSAPASAYYRLIYNP